MEYIFRLYDFNVYNAKDDSREESGSDEETNSKTDTNKFVIQMFGLNELGESCSILVDDFKPFFYVKVNDEWTQYTKNSFLQHILKKLGKYYQDSITDCKLIKRKKLYGFDGGKEHKFIIFQFKNLQAFNKAKNLWYTSSNSNSNSERKLLENGLVYANTSTYLYEANIPPLLRFFHIKDISPSGWVALPKKKTIEIRENKQTTCKHEFIAEQKYILPLNEKETRVPYKICSFDIEASSSHGDFPVPIKSYKKLATNIIEYFEKINSELSKSDAENILRKILLKAFGFNHSTNEFLEIDLVYPKADQLPKSEDDLKERVESWLSSKIDNDNKTKDYDNDNQMTIEKMFENMNNEDNEDTNNEFSYFSKGKSAKSAIKNYTVVDLLFDKTLSREIKLNELNKSLSDKSRSKPFPSLEGDKVTFIGTTFLKAGDKDPYLNHCIVLNTCGKVPVDNCEIESYQTEQDVLTAWTKLIQKENPDIIIGYNIFGFDYAFMFNRALENNCIAEFLKLSKNKNETCCKDPFTGKYKLDESTLQIASGQHDLKYIKINGRIQIDLYNYFRREENLSSYKLDYVAGHFIGDYVKTLEINKEDKNETTIYSGNLTGLLQGSFIHFEEIGHSTDYYSDGAKFSVISINKETKSFVVSGIIKPDMSKKVRWCLAKDDVTPKDIFRMTNGTADDRAVIAKYCIQDCNLVHYLMNKVDILTGFIEMAKICSVPINFLILRGQGIKLTSYVAKKCREKRTLMPVIEKQDNEDGYEGAIVLDPKCDLYLDNPVACVDYASLYPSSMISENLSHDSKVWTKEYNLLGELVTVTGDMDETGNPIYDNLPGYDYVDITYDTFKYVRKTPSAAAEKIKSGYKICRFAQFPDNAKAIMPSILQELLLARKTTRKQIPLQTDDFMKNVLDKRQLGYKVTANSLYGQCGARTSTFYEKDIAASTTATGRLLLTYAKKVIENTYGNRICDTSKHGPVLTKAEYIYGDSVANYTPVYIKTNGEIDICTIENLAEKYGENNWLKCKEEGKQEKEFCELQNVETWTDKGWTKLYRVIRHELASHKKMMRVLTHTGLVDVTDDHSLLKPDGNEISPTDLNIGDELLHNKLPVLENIKDTKVTIEEAQVMGFFFGDGSCGNYDCPSGKKSSWALNNASMDIINKYINLCKKAYPDFEWVCMPTIESSGVYKITFKTKEYGSIKKFVEKYREKMYFEKSKKIPNEILFGTLEIRQAFWNGLYDADGDKDKNGYKRIDQKNQISASHITWLAQSLGWNTSINTRQDKQNIYRMTMTKKMQRKNSFAIKKLHDIQYQGYVYDLTTDNHHFAAGVGNMIVHNTDSVFFTFNLHTPEGKPIRGKDALEITIELAQEAGHLASSFLKNPHDLEYEKTFMPFCLLSKKRYVGMLYEHDPEKCKRKEMGIVLKRRDNAPIVKDIYGGIIDILMKKQNIKEATDFLKSCLKNIVDEKYPMDKLIITKSLRSGYKNPQQIAHKVLADRITSRDPGNKPSSGDRIPFVYIHNSNKKALQGEKIETPTYIKENNLKIDYSFYITNQIMKPVQQLFALVLEKMWEMQNKKGKIIKFKKEVEQLKKSTPVDKFDDKLESIKNKEVKALLFDEFLRETNNQKTGNQSVMKFFK
uniref:DNA polymerase n=1 Tax=viral metagenome TaxID=1070528 RepID=A0A6C0D8V7_9ZZZZ